jgi:hypothetical protein
MKSHFIPKDDSFVIHNYNHADPFSSFFPALAGETGRPLWLFYTNRGQAVAGFGVNNKDGAMLEFLPANKAYQSTPLLGFRTFVRPTNTAAWSEPFSPHSSVAQDMEIRFHELELLEKNNTLGIETKVIYFGVPNEMLPVLARRLEIKNTGNKKATFEIIDGLPRLVPYGMNDYLTKHMSRTIEAFAEVRDWDTKVPFFKLRMEPTDRPEIQWLDAGFFSMGIFNNEKLPVVVDPSRIFGHDTTFLKPLDNLAKGNALFFQQLKENIMPASLFSTNVTLKPGESAVFNFYYGFAENNTLSQDFAKRVINAPTYLQDKREDMRNTVATLAKRFGFKSSNPVLNNYTNTSFLDNVLRGGYPLMISDNGPLIHVFSRKHGDMERDYNSFHISSNFYSQGNGNFRDVNQNRRHDLYLDSRVGTANIDFFFNHLQLDGYNPLVINPERFIVSKNVISRLSFVPSEEFNRAMHSLTRQPVFAGDIYAFVQKFSSDPLNIASIFKEIMTSATPINALKHEEGYWIDHWIYNLDHLEQYVTLFPDKMTWLFYEKEDFTYYDSEHYVQPRHDKYVLTMQGQLRQYNAVIERKDKQELINSRTSDKYAVRKDNGQGEVLKTTLFVKLLGLITVKFSTLDPFGVGLEMEANKPGWCDALNGAPGVFGSSTHEMISLHRLIRFLLNDVFPLAPTKAVEVPIEFLAMMRDIDPVLSSEISKDFRHSWDQLCLARESFRAKTILGISGKTRPHRLPEIKRVLEKMSVILQKAEEKAIDPQTQLPTSYFTHAVDIQNLPESWRSNMGKLEWRQHRLPSFLEGSVHMMKVLPEVKSRRLYNLVKKSPLYDKKLGMYKLNSPLTKESSEIGRVTVFTPGWLENESIFLHMHYKYLLEILKAGMYDEFFKEIKTGWVAFRDPQQYGRSVYENSSFICSSSFPNPQFHGRGFVARLSGATVEFMSMMYRLFLGPKPFSAVEGG